MTEEQILAAYPDLEREDIGEALHYAAEAVRERELPLATPWPEALDELGAVGKHALQLGAVDLLHVGRPLLSANDFLNEGVVI